MTVTASFSIMAVEIALVVLALAVLVVDLFSPKRSDNSTLLANVAMFGAAGIFMGLSKTWGHFGYAFGMSFIQDGLSVVSKAILALAGLFTLFMAREYAPNLQRGRSEFILLILFALTGAFFLVSANDFLLFFVALETLSISLYIMTAYLRENARSIEAGVKYLILGALSTAAFLFGLSYVYGTTGSTNYYQIQQTLSGWDSLPAGFVFGMILILASLGFKIAAVPFQLWVPDIYQGAPTPVTSFLATASKTAAFVALTRLMITVFTPAHEVLTGLFAVLAAATILYGNLGAIPQTNLKRLLGYSSIGHAGYLLIGFVGLQGSGKEAVLFYLLSYVFSTTGAFLVLIGVLRTTRSSDISELAGLSKRSPLLAAAMLISLMSLAGVPPLAGFFAKFYLLWTATQKGYLWLVAIGVLNVITSLYYYLKVIKTIYVDEPADPSPLTVSFDQKAMQLFIIVMIVLMGICQGPFVNLVQNAFAYTLK